MAKVKKGFHKTKSGKIAKKGLYFYANKRRKAGRNLSEKVNLVTVTKAAIKRSAKTARS